MSDLEVKGLQYPIMRQKYEDRIDVLETRLQTCREAYGEVAAENAHMRKVLQDLSDWEKPNSDSMLSLQEDIVPAARALLKQGETK